MSLEAWGDENPDDRDYDHLIESGWLSEDQAKDVQQERDEWKAAALAAREAIRDCIRRPMGVEPDSATAALKMIDVTEKGWEPMP